MTRLTVGILVMSVLVLAGCSDTASNRTSVTPASAQSAGRISSSEDSAATNRAERDQHTRSHAIAVDASAPSADTTISKAGATRSHGHGHGHQAHGSEAPRIVAEVSIGQKVPDFEITLNGLTRKLSELQQDESLTHDGVLAFTFWCSFCHSCRDVEHDLDRLAATHKGRAGVIALDASAGETAEAIKEFAQKQKLSLPIALNPGASVADLFGITATTTTVVIDADGVLRYCGMFGDRNHTYAEDALVAVLSGKDVSVTTTEHRG